MDPSKLLTLPAFYCLFAIACFASTNLFGQSVESNQTEKEPVTIMVVGDIMLDNGPGHIIANGSDPFIGCKNLLEKSDITIGNLECVVGREGTQLNKAYTFRAARESPKYLKLYFDGLSLANNHTFDFGEEGISSSIEALQKEGIAFFGAGASIERSRRPLILEAKGHRIAFLGYNNFRSKEYAATETTSGNSPMIHEWILEDIAKARTESRCDIVIPYVHWGEEMMAMPTPEQRSQARSWIDAGATAVIGGHPHVTQTLDVYRGAPIVYSLGNFVFDYYPVDPPEWIGWMIELSIDSQGKVDFQTFAVTIDPAGLPHPAQIE